MHTWWLEWAVLSKGATSNVYYRFHSRQWDMKITVFQHEFKPVKIQAAHWSIHGVAPQTQTSEVIMST